MTKKKRVLYVQIGDWISPRMETDEVIDASFLSEAALTIEYRCGMVSFFQSVSTEG